MKLKKLNIIIATFVISSHENAFCKSAGAWSHLPELGEQVAQAVQSSSLDRGRQIFVEPKSSSKITIIDRSHLREYSLSHEQRAAKVAREASAAKSKPTLFSKTLRFARSPLTLAVSAAAGVLTAGYYYLQSAQSQAQTLTPDVNVATPELNSETTITPDVNVATPELNSEVTMIEQGEIQELDKHASESKDTSVYEYTQDTWNKISQAMRNGYDNVANYSKPYYETFVANTNRFADYTKDQVNTMADYTKKQYKEISFLVTKSVENLTNQAVITHEQYSYALPTAGIIVLAGVSYGVYHYMIPASDSDKQR